MKKIIIPFLVLSIYSKSLRAQCTFNDFENIINTDCNNCNQTEVNNFISSKCDTLDRVLSNNISRFERKISISNFTKVDKIKYMELFNSSKKQLFSTRKIVVGNLNKMTDKGYNNYYYYMQYWYITDKIINILLDYETTLFGD